MKAKYRLRNARRILELLILPVVLASALVFGGASGEGCGAHAILLAGAALAAAICIFSWDTARFTSGFATLISFLLVYVALCVLHLMPLPTATILALPGRLEIAKGWELLGVRPESTSLSMAPERTARALSAAIIPLTAILLVYRLGWTRTTTLLPWCLMLLGAASGLFGFAQVLIPVESDLYLYDVTSPGLPVGMFANANHQASFLLMTLPFTAALIGDTNSESRSGDGERARLVVLVSLGLVQLVGVLAVGSVAGYLMLGPVLVLAVLIARRRRGKQSGRSTILLLSALFAGALLVATSPILEGLGITSFSTNDMSRLGIARTAQHALSDHVWLGSGVGTFEPVFKLYEDPQGVTRVFANHAHNDYLQWAIETGLPGLVLLLVFLGWWFGVLSRVWLRSRDNTTRIRKAASAVTLIVFMHSFVDYPIRTPAILTLASVCLALMVLGRRRTVAGSSGGDTIRRVEL